MIVENADTVLINLRKFGGPGKKRQSVLSGSKMSLNLYHFQDTRYYAG